MAAMRLSTYRKIKPGALEEIIFYDHPSVRARVQAMMDWKAAHPKPEAAPPAAAAAPAATPPT